VDRAISVLLLAGVLLAAALILLGLLRLLLGASAAGEPATVAEMIAQEAHPTSIDAIFAGVSSDRPTSLIRLGILVLLLTPVARVGLTLVVFLIERDLIFVFLTAVVLALLLLGLDGRIGA
jgi:uncharacterized membrane protein